MNENATTRTQFVKAEKKHLFEKINDAIDRTKAVTEVLEGNFIEECTAHRTLSDRTASKLCFQVTENLGLIEAYLENLQDHDQEELVA